ncbi:YdeI/OmpD-associated family protein [bacterium]|nr:YdeI/OmpD-associated family protein [bacterium]
MTVETLKDLPILPFESPDAWRAWLAEHHTHAPGVWVRLYKKGSGYPSITYAEALNEALCYGWIDSTKNKYDAESFLQRFSPRKARSPWSKVNREHVARLIEAGKMQPAGQQAIEEAKRNGQWDAAYDSPSQAQVPEDFLALLDQHPEAKAFFEGLNKTNRYALYYRIQAAKKPETRARRLAWALDLMLKQEKLY